MPDWKQEALDDRDNYVEYIAEDNPVAAVELGDLLMGKADQLDINQELGKKGRVKGTREYVAHPNYILVYRIVGDAVEILRVLHASMRWPPKKTKNK